MQSGLVVSIAGVTNGPLPRISIVSPDWATELSDLSADIGFREVHGPHVIMHTEPEMIAGHIREWLAS